MTIVLPIATIIETGNHISQSAGDRYTLALKFAAILQKAADSESPWAAFSEHTHLWSPERLKELARQWPELAAQKVSIGDTTIKDVADFYAKTGFYEVEILTGDMQLRSYQPSAVIPQPRRRK